MAFLDELFSRVDIDYRQHRELEQLRVELADARLDAAPRRALGALLQRVERLELINRALVELIVAKGLVTADELSVMTQQVDLLDGVEDGRISAEVHARAPTCGACGRYVNPARAACVYCGEAVAEAVKPRRPARAVTCAMCAASVPERSTYFTSRGVICEPCFIESEG